MPESPLKGPVPEDLLAVAGHCCGARLTRLPELENGIDFTPDAAVRAAFAAVQAGAATSTGTPPTPSPQQESDTTATRGRAREGGSSETSR